MAKKNDELFSFLPDIDENSPQGTVGCLRLSQLKPTQNAVGMDEVNAKVKKIKAKNDDQLTDYLLPRTVPVIIGNGGQYYLIDHHHLTKSLWMAKGDMAIPVLVMRNWAPIKGDRFWKAMAGSNWVYPFDAMGAGPFNPVTLKQHVTDLDNDLYRSLSWVVREAYGYVKDPNNAIFAEFKWGTFFRTRVIFNEQLTSTRKNPAGLTLGDIESADPEDYADKIAYARHLASSPEAAGLPGFVGRSR
ncbi:ParB/Srx family N-terminal domain-containing protein [Accumulibacter sp.]|uniref:ParB/Srx family N-terminal domain-containing protein n=1 Tax=Accumulibacter sp. TaxID=2053492 RepID=UPI0025FFE843|nr:ParB/Srx family N-terminal domain-containing protein [Accumulibacter sp.]MCM8595193.1 ParB/Srx family N-terminal domain-containing protein [Accumulibacter sp.]MCM8625193.1 ParB/Srx family N-terminal domain-containing protein [Accumulibacter sp.]MDS4049339.1 ParB/Srx family N-terminal domain-containing protein [Accumulibacter sp.]